MLWAFASDGSVSALPVAIVSPCCGELKPLKSGGSVMYLTVTVAFGLAA